jgi:hypothetical protein
LTYLQEKAQAEGKLRDFGTALDAHVAYYKINIDPTTKKYFPASCSGTVAKQLCKKVGVGPEVASHLGMEGHSVHGWLDDIGFDEEYVLKAKAIWRTWAKVVIIGRALKPTESQQAEFGPLCKRLFRYAYYYLSWWIRSQFVLSFRF